MTESKTTIAEVPWLTLGRPIHLFIDTSVFRAMKYHFGGSRIEALVSRLLEDDIVLLMPEITKKEIEKHIAEATEEAKQSYASFKNKSAILSRLAPECLAPLLQDIDWVEAQKTAIAALEEFLTTSGVIMLPISGEDAALVFEDFFSRKPPFGDGKKKSEFPDAFALRALLRYAQEEDCHVAILAEDGDWKAACKEHSTLILCPDLPSVIEHSQAAKATLERVRHLLEKHTKELESAVLKEFVNRGFNWDSEYSYDSEVTEVYDEAITSWPWSVVDVEDHWAQIEGDAQIAFRASVTYPDPDLCYRDSDTKDMVYLGNQHATLFTTLPVPVRVTVDVRALEAGQLILDAVEVDTNGDVWFTEDQIEDQHGDYEG